jgi:hypothetical protein
MNRPLSVVKQKYSSVLEDLRVELSRFSDKALATVLCIPRHGHAVTGVCLENLYEQTDETIAVVYVDVVSPPEVRRYLERQSLERPGFFHLKIDDYISRQTARLLVLDCVSAPFTVFMDNNMLVGKGWLAGLVRCADMDAADVVSPFIVMQGGNVHFSGARLARKSGNRVSRTQTTRACPMAVPISKVTPEKLEIDFAESHCCLLRTAAFKGRIPEVFLEELHNSFSLAVSTHILKTTFNCRMVIDPETIVSILPIAFGYDIPWIFESYNDLRCFQSSYELNESIVGTADSTTLGNLLWHRKHLIYLLYSMMGQENLWRNDLLRPDEVPDYVDGYDKPMPVNVITRIESEVIPFVQEKYPGYGAHIHGWLYDIGGIIRSIEQKQEEFTREPPGRLSTPRGFWWRRLASENRSLY